MNRTNISGIINGGIIGGINQSGKYKMDCRFNKLNIIERICKIAKKKQFIRLFNYDALDIIQKIEKEEYSNNSIIIPSRKKRTAHIKIHCIISEIIVIAIHRA